MILSLVSNITLVPAVSRNLLKKIWETMLPNDIFSRGGLSINRKMVFPSNGHSATLDKKDRESECLALKNMVGVFA